MRIHRHTYIYIYIINCMNHTVVLCTFVRYIDPPCRVNYLLYLLNIDTVEKQNY